MSACAQVSRFLLIIGDIQAIDHCHPAREFALRLDFHVVLAPVGSHSRIKRQAHRNRIGQADSIFAGLSLQRDARVAVALNGKVSQRRVETPSLVRCRSRPALRRRGRDASQSTQPAIRCASRCAPLPDRPKSCIPPPESRCLHSTVPPITTQRLTFAARSGRCETARATFVSGPRVTRISPGFASMVSMMASTACLGSADRGGAG